LLRCKVASLLCCKLALLLRCLFVFTRPAGTRERLLLKSVPLPHCILVQNVHVIIISAGTIARSSRFGPESTRGPIIATRHPASQAQGKRSPHDLPDLLSGRGLTHEGPCLKICKNVKLKNKVKKEEKQKTKDDTTLILYSMV
jgi:hypothetical protein